LLILPLHVALVDSENAPVVVSRVVPGLTGRQRCEVIRLGGGCQEEPHSNEIPGKRGHSREIALLGIVNLTNSDAELSYILLHERGDFKCQGYVR
jgi:hypothetical protein